MSDYGATDTSTTALGTNQFPLSSAFVPGDTKLTAVEGGGKFTDGNGKVSTPVVTEDIERPGYVALTSPPTQTNAGTETVLTFSSQVNRVEIYNGGGANLNYAFDATVTAGSLVLPPGYQLDKAKKITAVHILTATATNVNGSTAGNIVVLGSL
jgi:hypothetical protein